MRRIATPDDEAAAAAYKHVLDTQDACVVGIQTACRLTYTAAVQAQDALESAGVISKPNAMGERRVLAEATS